VVAAWIPDVDNPRSRLGNGLSRMRSPTLNAITRPVSWALRATSFTLSRTVGHRTLTHSLLGVVLFVALVSPVAPLLPDLFVALVAG
jgi:inner membrane protein